MWDFWSTHKAAYRQEIERDLARTVLESVFGEKEER